MEFSGRFANTRQRGAPRERPSALARTQHARTQALEHLWKRQADVPNFVHNANDMLLNVVLYIGGQSAIHKIAFPKIKKILFVHKMSKLSYIGKNS